MSERLEIRVQFAIPNKTICSIPRDEGWAFSENNELRLTAALRAFFSHRGVYRMTRRMYPGLRLACQRGTDGGRPETPFCALA